MPLPEDAFTVHGGCNCRAIRYAIHVPSAADRMPDPRTNGAVTLPYIVICHCNDCRSAVANLTLTGFCCPIDLVEFSSLNRSEAPKLPSSGKVDLPDQDPRRKWLPARAVCPPQQPTSDSFLAAYSSSDKATRTFCSRCGTGLTYSYVKPPERNPPMLDVYVGSIDREDLVKYSLKPDRHVWWNMGIDWIHDLYKEGPEGLPKHPLGDVSKVVEDVKLAI